MLVLGRAGLMALVCLAQACTGVVNPATVDGSSQEGLKTSLEEVKASLPASQREKFTQALQVLMGKLLEELAADGREPADQAWAQELNGKSGREIIAEAEAVVRDLIAEHEKRQQAVTSAVLESGARVATASLTCSAVLSASIMPGQPSEGDYLEITDTSLLKSKDEIAKLSAETTLESKSRTGTDTLAIRIDGDRLHVMTRAAVESGIATAAPMIIVRNSDDEMAAIAAEEIPLSFTLETFLLNKQNGYAVWTKSRPRYLIQDVPDTQAIYFRCR